LLLGTAAAPVVAQVPASVDIGDVPDSRPVSVAFAVQNPSTVEVARIDFLTAAAALSVKPDRLVLGPLESAQVEVSYTPQGYSGTVTRLILVKSSLAQLDNTRVILTAKMSEGDRGPIQTTTDCDACMLVEVQFSEEALLTQYETSVVLIDFYYDPECAKCLSYVEERLPALAKAAGRHARVAILDVNQQNWRKQLEYRLAARGSRWVGIPVAFVDGEFYRGMMPVRLAVRAALRR
jgi:hypothetical protein